jgi:hypothetical protein
MLSDFPPPALRIGSIGLCFTRVIIPGIPGGFPGLDAMVVPQAADKWNVVPVDGRGAAPVGNGRASDFPGGGRFIFRNSRGTPFGDQGG